MKNLLELVGVTAVVVGVGVVSVPAALIVGGLAVVLACEVR